jgi:hypothetical protein
MPLHVTWTVIQDPPTDIFEQRGPKKTVSSTYKAVNSAPNYSTALWEKAATI